MPFVFNLKSYYFKQVYPDDDQTAAVVMTPTQVIRVGDTIEVVSHRGDRLSGEIDALTQKAVIFKNGKTAPVTQIKSLIVLKSIPVGGSHGN